MAAFTPAAIKARTFETLRQLSFRSSRQSPLILAIEDLHWSDATSEEYLTSLVEALPGAPMLLLCTYRPGYRPPWLEKSYATQVALPRLDPEESLGAMRAVLQMDQIPASLAQVILDRAEGNPFFLEELARVVGEQDGLHSTLEVPDTIQGVLTARIERLSDGPKVLLQTASILGREVSLGLLKAVWEGSASLEPQLAQLIRLEFLYEERGGDEPVYVFKHALTQEVAPARRHRVGPLLPEGQDGWGPRCQGWLGRWHPCRPRIQPMVPAVVPTWPKLCVPLGGAPLCARQERCRDHRPVLPRFNGSGTLSPCTPHMWGRFLRSQQQGMLPRTKESFRQKRRLQLAPKLGMIVRVLLLFHLV